MRDVDFDLNIAMLKKNIGAASEDDSDKSTKTFGEKQLGQMMDKISGFTFEKALLCDSLFSMLMPSELFGEPLVMENVHLFQSPKEKMTMVIKAVDSEQIVDFEKVKKDYMIQMRNSKQQTQIDISDSAQCSFGTVYYFSAIHAMPGGALCDFVILFQARRKLIVIDFNFDQKDYFFWKPIFCKLSSTIQLEGEEDI